MANGVATKGATKTMQKPKPDSKRDSIFTRAKRFLRESYIEVRYKSAWPSWEELRNFTVVVLVAVIVVGFYLGLLDVILSKITKALGFGIS
jgi:preprotein translocase SecE subunit